MEIKSPEISNIFLKLKTVADEIENVHTEIAQKTVWSTETKTEIERLIPILQACNQALIDKKFTPNQELTTSIERVLKAINSFSVVKNGQATKEKINALQVNLFALFISQLTNLEQTLRDWKEQSHKVQKTTQSSQA